MSFSLFFVLFCFFYVRPSFISRSDHAVNIYGLHLASLRLQCRQLLGRDPDGGWPVRIDHVDPGNSLLQSLLRHVVDPFDAVASSPLAAPSIVSTTTRLRDRGRSRLSDRYRHTITYVTINVSKVQYSCLESSSATLEVINEMHDGKF